MNTSVQPTFLETLESLSPDQNAIEPLRKMAKERLSVIGMPTPKDERYKYSKLSKLLKDSKERLVLKRPDEKFIQDVLEPYSACQTLVFYNGLFYPRYSSYSEIEDDLVVLPLSEAWESYSTVLINAFESCIKEERDPFALLNLSLFEDGLFVYVPKNVRIEKSVSIIEINDTDAPNILPTVCFFSLGENSSLSLSSQSCGTSASGLNLSSKLFHLNAHAHCLHERSATLLEGYQFDSTRATLQKESTLKELAATIGSQKHHTSFEAIVFAYAHAEITKLNALKEKEEAHDHIWIRHADVGATSRQLVKNLLDGESTSDFTGMIYVDQAAQKTNAYQLNQNCLLSDQANAYSRPGLEIFADDVKASHGSTTGQMNQEELFYLNSRGLSLQAAKRLLLKGFCHEVLSQYESAALKEAAISALLRYFEAL